MSLLHDWGFERKMCDSDFHESKTHLNTFAVAVTPTSMWLWQACSAVSLSSHHSCSARAATESELRKMRMRVVCGLWVTQTEDSDLTTQWAPAGGSSESLSSGCDGCLLSSTCFLSDELTGISSLLIWIVLELRLIEKLGVLMLRSSLVHLCVSGTLRASVTHVFLWWLVLV